MNKINKISPDTITLWSRCLTSIPDSRLILQCDQFAHAGTEKRIKNCFETHGIDATPIECRGFEPHPNLFKTYHDIDIAFDLHPYSGCLTTCESLWMGVPFISFPGPTFAGRHSASFLTAVDLSDWIAADADAYVALAKEKSSDLSSLFALRKSLRSTMAASPFCDSDQFAENLGIALEKMWAEISDLSLSA